MPDSGFAEAFASSDWASELAAQLDAGELLRGGRNHLYRLELGGEVLAVKSFGRESLAKNQVDRKRGSKARRSFENAAHLAQHHVGTPAPVAWFENWDGARLTNSYLVTIFAEGMTDLRLELVRLFRESGLCSEYMALLETVAEALARMHASGLMHRDLGNQNIMLRRINESLYDQVQFIDLNRACIKHSLSLSEQGKDAARLYFPSDLRRIFHEMLFAPEAVPEAFQKAEELSRKQFDLHTRTRNIRHPIRNRKPGNHDPATRYPDEQDMWIWDDRSEQAISLLTGKDKHRHYSRSSQLRAVQSAVKAFAPAWKQYRQLKKTFFAKPVDMQHRVGIAISGRAADAEYEGPLLEQLGKPPVLIRFYHHETAEDWQALIARVKELKADGFSVAIALIQDRAAVSNPARWAGFCETVLGALHDQVDFAEIGHAINRVKWGIWDIREYAAMLEPLKMIRQQYPSLSLTGPAVIDFEYQYLAAALAAAPKAFVFDALSHHLYVDRRGAPENRQGPYDTVDKAALARAAARGSKSCQDRLIITEVNWPLKGTGVYSPVGSPYDSPGVRQKDPSVDEETYARYMIRYLLMTIGSGMAERVYWWKLGARGFGLVDINGRDEWLPRPAFHVMKTFLKLTAGQCFQSRQEPEPGVHLYVFDAFTIAYAEHEGAVVALPFQPTKTVDAAGFELESGHQKTELGPAPCYFYH
jgi:tRNA A-37 threonylcarbamoyl transferase component Bud32